MMNVKRVLDELIIYISNNKDLILLSMALIIVKYNILINVI